MNPTTESLLLGSLANIQDNQRAIILALVQIMCVTPGLPPGLETPTDLHQLSQIAAVQAEALRTVAKSILAAR